jgi:hypothetical protein
VNSPPLDGGDAAADGEADWDAKTGGATCRRGGDANTGAGDVAAVESPWLPAAASSDGAAEPAGPALTAPLPPAVSNSAG